MHVFITGASSGIGQALAIEYAKRYANANTVIALVARRQQELLNLAKNLKTQYGVTCPIYTADVRDCDALQTLASTHQQAYGTPNIIIANAGVSRGTLTTEAADVAGFQQVMDINVMGMVHTFQPFIQAMQQQAANGQLAQLVGIASVAGIRGLPGAGAYSASKAAAINYLESLRSEMQHDGIHVTTIAPGYIRTPMTDVNTHAMPFLMEAAVFARKAVDAITRQKRFVIIPWQMALVAKIMRLMPNIVWDYLTKNAPRKPRIDV